MKSNGSITMNDERRPNDTGLALPAPASEPALSLQPVPDYDEHALDLDVPSDPTAQAGRRNARSKMAAGWRGIKSAVRGDSSFFAHCYRGTLIVITAALLGIDQRGWCLIVIGASLVLIAELAHSAVDTLARAIGDPEEPRLKTAREIAAGGVLVAAFGSGAVTVIVLSAKFVKLLSGSP
jgi:diacylglycerol kinase